LRHLNVASNAKAGFLQPEKKDFFNLKVKGAIEVP
jgi:hypothetical protein